MACRISSTKSAMSLISVLLKVIYFMLLKYLYVELKRVRLLCAKVRIISGQVYFGFCVLPKLESLFLSACWGSSNLLLCWLHLSTQPLFPNFQEFLWLLFDMLMASHNSCMIFLALLSSSLKFLIVWTFFHVVSSKYEILSLAWFILLQRYSTVFLNLLYWSLHF